MRFPVLTTESKVNVFGIVGIQQNVSKEDEMRIDEARAFTTSALGSKFMSAYDNTNSSYIQVHETLCKSAAENRSLLKWSLMTNTAQGGSILLQLYADRYQQGFGSVDQTATAIYRKNEIAIREQIMYLQSQYKVGQKVSESIDANRASIVNGELNDFSYNITDQQTAQL